MPACDPYRTLVAASLVAALLTTGCAMFEKQPVQLSTPPPPKVLVVAPVINLSGGEDFDPLKVTDIVASEFLSFPGVSVVPVNLTLAALARRGQLRVETAADAIALAEELGADATVVTAVTEYRPHDPPIVGLVMQWYEAPRRAVTTSLDPVSASRQASSSAPELSVPDGPAPRWQVQRVLNAADQAVLDEVQTFAASRPGQASSYGWRKYTKSQELYVRYCCWTMIRTMLHQNDSGRPPPEPDEANG